MDVVDVLASIHQWYSKEIFPASAGCFFVSSSGVVAGRTFIPSISFSLAAL